jgi:acetylornithine deacetylase/succinyl-diaminopimelate desuccinylase-like protein
MSDARKAALQYAHEHRERFLEELKEFVAIPSVSTEPEHKPDMQHAAEWAARQLRSLGMEQVQIFSTAGHPVVFGQSLKAGSGAQTVLLYGHYDVQPAEPLELWESPAFEPTLRGENLYGRGASDMKGQVMAGLKAVESIVRTGELPVNLKVIIEGEEEIGSPNLGAFIAGHTELLACDFALNMDSSMIGAENPTITYGLRGLAYFELRVFSADHDLHSGSFGGVVHNPAQALCELVAGMHDAQGRITLPGFYDSVLPLSAEERAELARLPLDEAFYLKQTGAPALWGEADYTPTERIGGRPTLEVNGLLSGFTGEGSKTVLPARAMAKISMRLVPNQDPEAVHQQLIRYLEANAPHTIRWEVIQMAGSPASVTDRELPGVLAMSRAMESVWGVRPVFKREGGSVPVVAQMQDMLGVGSAIAGFGLPDDNLHAPNEKFHLPTWYRGIDTIIHFMFYLQE